MKRDWLIDLRDKANLTQKEMANELGISQQHYSRIELGILNAKPKIAKQIAQILNFNWTIFYEED